MMTGSLCPHCGSDAISPRINLNARRKLLGLLPYTALTTLAFSKSEYRCDTCGDSHMRRSPTSKVALGLVLALAGGLGAAIVAHA